MCNSRNNWELIQPNNWKLFNQIFGNYYHPVWEIQPNKWELLSYRIMGNSERKLYHPKMGNIFPSGIVNPYLKISILIISPGMNF